MKIFVYLNMCTMGQADIECINTYKSIFYFLSFSAKFCVLLYVNSRGSDTFFTIPGQIFFFFFFFFFFTKCVAHAQKTCLYRQFSLYKEYAKMFTRQTVPCKV